MTLPELLSPAGNLEKLKIAFGFGADAVFVGGPVFGLRKYADNFTMSELAFGLAFAHQRGKKVYVVLNGFAHQSDLPELTAHLEVLETLGVDGFIISDMGVFQLAKKYTTVPLHVSTQASVTNQYGAALWKEAGAKRIILAREVSISECKTILNHVDIELEVFVHGSMCASYSGKCIISNYSAGRDSNRGGCVQSCRHHYHVKNDIEGVDYQSHVMNAKDLNGVLLLPEILASGIASLKIEGRMKSNLYVANATRAYRRALDALVQDLHTDLTPYSTILSSVSNRQFSTGGLAGVISPDAQNREFGYYEQSVEYVGTVQSVEKDRWVYLQVKSPFKNKDRLKVMHQSGGDDSVLETGSVERFSGEKIESVTPNMVVRFPWIEGVQVLDVVMKV